MDKSKESPKQSGSNFRSGIFISDPLWFAFAFHWNWFSPYHLDFIPGPCLAAQSATGFHCHLLDFAPVWLRKAPLDLSIEKQLGFWFQGLGGVDSWFVHKCQIQVPWICHRIPWTYKHVQAAVAGPSRSSSRSSSSGGIPLNRRVRTMAIKDA